MDDRPVSSQTDRNIAGETSSPTNQDQLERELLYYQQEYNALGAQLLRAREEQGRVGREARRSRIVAGLIRQAHRIAGHDISAAQIGEPILATVADTSICERAALLRQDPAEPGVFQIEHALGAAAGQRLTIPDPPEFLFTSSKTIAPPSAGPMTALLQTPFILWGFEKTSGRALLLGNRTESNIHRAFEANDEELVRGTLAVYIDVLLRKRAEATLQQAKTAAEEANSARAQFLATLSHELRTPLNAIIGFSELLLEAPSRQPASEQRDEFARQILDAGRSLMSLVKDILEFSTLSNAVPSLQLDWVPVGQLFHNAARALAAEAARRQINIERDPVEPALQILIDYDKFRQILANLLGNALKFTRPSGQITISMQQLDQQEWTIAIRDTGEGIQPEDVARALEPFVQLESTRRRHIAGAGLGLPIAKQLAEAHQGRLMIESVYGEGTVVSIILPDERVRMATAAQMELPPEDRIRNRLRLK